MKIAIAQINCTVGDLAGNAAKILDFSDRAERAGAEVMIAPELALSGYPPEDLLLREDFNLACEETLKDLSRQIKGMTVIVGHPRWSAGKRYNAASVLTQGRVVATYHKHKLPNHTVFDEVRYFSPDTLPCVVEVAGLKLGITICADIWENGPAGLAKEAGAQLIAALNASPYHMDKQPSRYQAIRARGVETGLPFIYANLVGGQDELVFDGASFAMNAVGRVVSQMPAFQETLGFVQWEATGLQQGEIAPALTLEESVYEALCLGVRDYVEKNGFPGVVVGLSGGIDSAVTLMIAVDALGAKRVHAVMMPSDYTSEMSLEDARQLANNFNVRYSVIPIKQTFNSYLKMLKKEFKGLAPDETEENLQARIRGNILMALSNKLGFIVLTTGNKSEMAVGYATLYGDMAGGFAVIKDVPKTLVYRLARYRNRLNPVIPQRILERAPSAELKPNQCDQDTLPPYDILDAIIEAYVEQDRSPEEIMANGYSREHVQRVIRMIDRNEYKRRQAPVGVRITQRGFGKDRRYPIISKFRPKFETD